MLFYIELKMLTANIEYYRKNNQQSSKKSKDDRDDFTHLVSDESDFENQ